MAAETGRPQGLNQQRAKTEQELAALRKDYGQLKQTVNDELTEEREQVYRHLESIDELHELVLTLHENLIVTKAGDEFVERKTLSMQDEVALLRDQQHNREQEVRRTERDYHDKIVQQVLEEQLRQQYQHSQQLVAYKEELERAEADNKRQISELRMQAIELGYQRKQEDLANNEAVQKDFVKRSQLLQIQLEKIHSADTQVRWQDDQCPNCRKDFTMTRRKQHRHHCGTIYCKMCLTKTVPTGLNRLYVWVCDVCHTLLVQGTAP
ncbi:RUN and FYVE domain-containing protein 2-like [Aedes albopictus]|uniref:FYVE-type domain-containing protein n=1 Tax=Aedes albopictus TaxID=7160 RepID=A0ABM1ZJB2_AEDAL